MIYNFCLFLSDPVIEELEHICAIRRLNLKILKTDHLILIIHVSFDFLIFVFESKENMQLKGNSLFN